MHLIPTLFNVDKHRIAKVIRVDGVTSARVNHPGVQARKINHLVRRHTIVEVKQLGMPVAGPALVHNLGMKLGMEIIRFLTKDLQHITLPGLQGGIGSQKP